MDNGYYKLTKRGLEKVCQPVSKAFAMVIGSFFFGLALGYAWRMVQGF